MVLLLEGVVTIIGCKIPDLIPHLSEFPQNLCFSALCFGRIRKAGMQPSGITRDVRAMFLRMVTNRDDGIKIHRREAIQRFGSLLINRHACFSHHLYGCWI